MKIRETLKLILLLFRSLFGKKSPPVPMVCDPKERKRLIGILARSPLNIDYGNISFITPDKSTIRVELVEGKDRIPDIALTVVTDGQSEKLDRKGVRSDFFILDRFRFVMKTFFERDEEKFDADFIVFRNDSLSEEYHSRRNYVFNLNYAEGFTPKKGKSLSAKVVTDTGTGGGGRD